MENIIKTLPFYKAIKEREGSIYIIGGVVRDMLLKKESKDLDLVITGIPINELEQILSNFGKVDLVGKSFGILKFKTPDIQEIDIAIPRTERKVSSGYQGFEVVADHNLSIEDDLYRRDFKINSMALDEDGNLIDPFGGLEDIKNKKICLTNTKAFSEDPLRMLRAVQFSARFGFSIEKITKENIQKNAHKIKEISGERILIELDKIVKKGGKVVGLIQLIETGLFEAIFDKKFEGDATDVVYCDALAEYIFVMLKNIYKNPSEVFKNLLKGDLESEKIIKALTIFRDNENFDDASLLHLIFKMNQISEKSIESRLLSRKIRFLVEEMKKGEFPLTFKDLKVSGDDLMELGFSGKQIGDALKQILDAIYKKELNNQKEEIINFLKK